MMPGQGQTQVNTETLIRLLKLDIETITGKVKYLELRRLGIGAARGFANSRTPGNGGPFDIPGFIEILDSFWAETTLNLDLAKRQLSTLEERLRQVQSDIILPGSGPNNFPPAN